MIIDVLVILGLFISMGVAFLRGFIREVLTIAGVTGGMAAAYFGGPKLNIHMRGWLGVEDDPEKVQKLFDVIPYDMVSTALSYGLIFIVVVITLSIISHFIAETAKNMGLGAIDRTLGVIFGAVRAVLLLGLLYLPLYTLVEKETREEWFAGSRTHGYIQSTAHWISGFIPSETFKIQRDEIEEDTSAKIKDSVNTAIKNKVQNTQQNNNGENGYTEDFREQMDTLFEQDNQPQQ